MGTEAADRELQEFRDRAGGVATSSFFYHYARLVEILAALERIEQLVNAFGQKDASLLWHGRGEQESLVPLLPRVRSWS